MNYPAASCGYQKNCDLSQVVTPECFYRGSSSEISPDRGRKRLSPSPPSEPCVRFSRTRLSSR